MAEVDSPFAEYIHNGVIAADDIGAVVKGVMDENDPLKRSMLFAQLLEQITPENAEAAYDAVRENRGGWGRGRGRGGGDESRLMLNAWGRVDGEGAIEALTKRMEEEQAEREANGEGGRGRGGRGGRGGDDWGRGTFELASVVNGWATKDAAAASKWVETVEDDRQRGMMSNNVVRGLLVNGVDDAMAYVSSLPADDEGRNYHMMTIAEEVLEKGAESAADWVAGVNDPALKGSAMSRIAGSYAREDLDGAIEWVTQNAGDESASRAVSEVAEQWAEEDPKAVIDWAERLPANAQSGAFQEALDEWTESDPVAASEYLAQMPNSPVKNSAIEGFATELSREDPQSAVAWAETISDPALREDTLTEVARDWYRQDEVAALEWLQESGLSDDAQKAVVERDRRGWGGRR